MTPQQTLTRWRVASAILAVAIGTSTLVPLPPSPAGIPPWTDKLVHVAMYASLMFALQNAFARRYLARLAFAALCYGAAIECLQHFSGYRSGSAADGIANGIGIALVIIVTRYRRAFRQQESIHTSE